MKTCLSLLLIASALFAQARYQPTWDSIDKRPIPDWFGDAKFGIFIHWGVYSVPSFAPVGKYAEWYWNALEQGPKEKDGKPNPTWEFHAKNYGEKFPYTDFAPMFKAEMFDPAHWADVMQRSGARYVVLTSKHHDGFALWPSEHANKAWGKPWNSVTAGPKRDLIGDLAQAVRKRGMRMGLYYSLYEWYNPLWKTDQKRYAIEHMHPQFKDVVTRYKPSVIFSDGEWDMAASDWKSPELLAWLYNESPVRDEVVINDRWGKGTRHKHGGYWTTEYTPGLDSGSHAWEENRGMGHSYGYNRAERLADYHTGRELTLMLIDLVSRGGNFLLDIGPTADGRIPVIMEQRLTEIGQWMKTNSEAIYGTKSWVRTRQWSEGNVPEVKTGEFMIKYDVTDLIERKSPGQAVIEAFFTAKGDFVYAILPRWPGDQFALKNVAAADNLSVSMLGSPAPLPAKSSGSTITVDLPRIPPDADKVQYAYVLRFTGIKPR